jgi:ATP-dependent Clp protease adaptor protein ClpS
MTGVIIATVTPTEIRPEDLDLEPDQSAAEDHPWVVLVWNDPINLMSYVTFVLQKLFGYSLEKATELMMQVHQEGRAVVAEGSREQAEMHVFRLHEHGLWATCQHDR